MRDFGNIATFLRCKIGENSFFMGLRLYNFQGNFLYIISFYVNILQMRNTEEEVIFLGSWD